MISPNERFWITAEREFGNGQRSTDMVDWDQRRWYTVIGPACVMSQSGDFQAAVLRHYINVLGPEFYTLTVDSNGNVVTMSRNPEDDPALVPHYPLLSSAHSLRNTPVICVEDLVEEERIRPGVDFVAYHDENGTRMDAAFKYNILHQRRHRIWNELHLTKSLPPHPNLVPFDRIVVSSPLATTEPRILGFTTRRVSGGTLDENRTRPFKLEHLFQLFSIVDFLNFDLGIVHQDIAARNLVLDPETNALRLFDFDRAAIIGSKHCNPVRNDAKGVIFTVYEIITHDKRFRKMPHHEQDPEVVVNLPEWDVRAELDHDVEVFREYLKEWIESRKLDRARKVSHGQADAEPLLDMPMMPPPSPGFVTARLGAVNGFGDDRREEPVYRRRTECLALDLPIIHWERPVEETKGPL